MKLLVQYHHRFLTLVFLIAMLSITAMVHAQEQGPTGGKPFDELEAQLIADGIPAETVNLYFRDSRFELIPRLLRVNIKQPDAKDAYEGFKTDAAARKTYKFLKQHQDTFTEVLSGSPVEAEVVASILHIESDFGGNQGKFPVLNVFATLSLLDLEDIDKLSPGFWDRILDDVPQEEREKALEKAEGRRKAKARWAYRELKTLLEMAEKREIDPLAVKGSWAGAYGMPQFLPTSLQAYGKSGDNDEIVDLDTLHDSIASVNNYLEEHGYKKEDEKRRRKAVWHYNHAQDYVDAVITLADNVAALEQKETP